MRLLLEKVYNIIKNFLKKLLGMPQYLLENKNQKKKSYKLENEEQVEKEYYEKSIYQEVKENIKQENKKLREQDKMEHNENKNPEKEMILNIYKQINDNKIDLKTLPMPILIKVMLLANEQNKLCTQRIAQEQETLKMLELQIENLNEETEKIKRKIQ